MPVENYQLPSGLKRLSFINQAEELVQQINTYEDDDLEEQEALRKQNQINIQNYDQIIFQDKNVDTSDLAPTKEAHCGTSE